MLDGAVVYAACAVVARKYRLIESKSPVAGNSTVCVDAKVDAFAFWYRWSLKYILVAPMTQN